MGLFMKVFGSDSANSKQETNARVASDSSSFVKSDEHLSTMGRHYYNDPYEYMQNFLREYREAERARLDSGGRQITMLAK